MDTAEDAEDTENAEFEKKRPFTQSVSPKTIGSEPKLLLLRVFRVLSALRGNSHRRF